MAPRRLTLGEIRRAEQDRSFSAACIGFAVAVALCATGAIAYAYGRAVESELALDAFGMANNATELLREYVPIGEAALAECISENEGFRVFLEEEPVWGARVQAMMMAEGPGAPR
ncbi:MAG: hypothetical protein OEW52_00220 [Thermoleophilia bacterium]|nr:hypothetical protein [Thermoleophilia bacterium]